MAFPSKNSRMAIVKESTEGTPVSPTSGDNYIPLRDGFDFDYAIEDLENDELTGSIGRAKTVLGLENPALSSDGYIRHSGVEGTAPDHDPLYESAFGSKATRATERDVVSATAGTASAAATIDVDAGEGVEFQAGDAVLIKDSVNGYSIRCVDSVSTDTLTLNFNLDNAPAAAVNLGKNILYKPADSGHPTLTAWLYAANQAAVEMAAGMRVTELGISGEAGQFIESSFSLEGTEGYFNPIEITASTDTIDFNDGAPQTATLSVGFFKDPHEAAAALQTAMDGQSTDNITVTFDDSTGKFSADSDGITFDVNWATTVNTLGAAFGYTADDSGGGPYVSDSAQDYSSPQTPTFDTGNPLVAKSNEAYLGTFDDTVCFSTRSVDFTLTDAKEDKLDICAASGKSGTVVDSREVSVDIVANIPQHDADKFKRFRENETTKFMWVFGTKSGGNWEAGKSGALYMKTATISAFKLGDEAGQVVMEMTLSGFVESGNSEVFLNFV